MAESPDQVKRTSACDRIRAERVAEIDSAAFDLVAIRTDEAVEEIKTKSTAEQHRIRAAPLEWRF